MLQTFLLIAVPALVTLTAAFYILHRISGEEQELHRSHQFNALPGNWTTARSPGGDTVANRRPRNSPTPRAARSPGGDTVANRRPRNSSTPQAHTGECVICYEEKSIVELYPCRHQSLCVDCVVKIISWNTRVCPLCRSRILGYSEVF